MPIVLLITGVLLIAISDWLQPDPYRKPILNQYMSIFGGLLWFAGIVLAFMNYSFVSAIAWLFASFILGAILRVKPSR